MESSLEQFSERCPVAVMARLGLQRAVGAEWVEAVFAEHRGMQYTREPAFSTVVDLMALGCSPRCAPPRASIPASASPSPPSTTRTAPRRS